MLDNSTVLYTTNCRWISNYKDGHAILQDPWAMQYLFKKVDNEWKIISINESGVKQSVKNTETSNQLNQVELMKQFIGTWKGEIGNNATFMMEGKPYCNGLEFYWKTEANGKILSEGKSLFGYDKINERLLDFQIISNSPDIILWAGLYTSPNIYEAILLKDISSPEKATEKWKYEFQSSDMMVCTYTVIGKTPIITPLHREK